MKYKIGDNIRARMRGTNDWFDAVVHDVSPEGPRIYASRIDRSYTCTTLGYDSENIEMRTSGFYCQAYDPSRKFKINEVAYSAVDEREVVIKAYHPNPAEYGVIDKDTTNSHMYWRNEGYLQQMEEKEKYKVGDEVEILMWTSWFPGTVQEIAHDADMISYRVRLDEGDSYWYCAGNIRLRYKTKNHLKTKKAAPSTMVAVQREKNGPFLSAVCCAGCGSIPSPTKHDPSWRHIENGTILCPMCYEEHTTPSKKMAIDTSGERFNAEFHRWLRRPM
jgi:hypothetical protein